MDNHPVRRTGRKEVVKRPQTEEEELMELNEIIFSNRPPLDFASYQREVMEKTPEWPIKEPNKVFLRIMINARAAMGGNKQQVVIQTAAILRALAELSDYIPISLERIAHISLSELPQTQGEIAPNSSDVGKIS